MKTKRIVKLLIIYSNGMSQIINIIVKNENDLEKFKNFKFTNVINMRLI